VQPAGAERPPQADLAAPLERAWGPAWRLAAAAGLSPYGPLTLPGRWIIS